MKRKKLLKNGRDKGMKGAMSLVKVEMQHSEAFKSLTASSIRVLLYALFLNYWASTHDTGRPVFKFTNKTAREQLGMNQQTFTRAKQDLFNKGFWKWTKRGGLKGCNGIASEFTLTSEWKAWVLPQKQKASHNNVTGGNHSNVTGSKKTTEFDPRSSHASLTGLPKKQSRQLDTINTITKGYRN